MDTTSPSPPVLSHDATQYHLHGAKAEIVFFNGDDDAMKLEYNGRTFTGRALYRERGVLGLIVSAELEAVPDLKVVSLSVVIPAVHVRANIKSERVVTFAVLSTGRTSIAGPRLVPGQLQTYEVIALEGNAW